MRSTRQAALAVLLAAEGCAGHGALTLPPSRNGGNIAQDGSCANGSCMWFSQPAEIPGEPTVNSIELRTYNVNVSSGARDWSRRMPWRAPGTAPVYGSGCGSLGGGPIKMSNGGDGGDQQGMDGATLPVAQRQQWKRGGAEEVAWRLTANHGGGYSYRLCKADGNISEACFQRTPLRFSGEKQWLQFDGLWQYAVPSEQNHSAGRPPPKFTPGRRVEIPLTRVTVGGVEWARNPVPGCLLCDQGDCPTAGMPNSPEWQAQQHCAQSCSGINMTSCYGQTQFPEPHPQVSGYTGVYANGGDDFGAIVTAFPYNIVDLVVVPDNLEPGEYLLSWRWDCEQSKQIWQNCADVTIY